MVPISVFSTPEEFPASAFPISLNVSCFCFPATLDASCFHSFKNAGGVSYLFLSPVSKNILPISFASIPEKFPASAFSISLNDSCFRFFHSLLSLFSF
jgi:hypothetical protein